MIDIDVNDRTPPKPCQTPGCDAARYHVCSFGKPNLFPQLLGTIYKNSRRGRPGFGTGPRSDAWRKGVTDAQQARWAAFHEANKDRDAAMVALYKEGSSFRAVSDVFKVSKTVVQNVLARAAKDGLVKIRRRGYNRRFANTVA